MTPTPCRSERISTPHRPVLAACMVLGWLGACASRGGTGGATAWTAPGESPTRATVRGDWNDAEAAAIAAADRSEMAILMVAPEGDSTLVVDLTTVSDEPARLTARRAEPDMIGLEARVGRFGDPARERALLRSMERRLRELAGRDWAPRR